MIWRRRPDIPFGRDGSARFLTAIVGVMVYLAALALAGTLALDGVLHRWDASLTGTVTVELPAVTAGQPPDGNLHAALDVLAATPGVAKAQPLDRDATLKLLEPWLGTDLPADDLALPRLIDVRLAGRIDAATLKTRLATAAPGAVLDDHRDWVDRLVSLALSIETTALAILVLISAAAVFTVIFTTRAGLAVHHDVIDLLHLIGAHDGYIAHQFEREALWLGLKGGIVGLGLAGVTLAALAHAADAASQLSDTAKLLPRVDLSPWSWSALLLLPVAAALIAMVTARLTVLRALARLP